MTASFVLEAHAELDRALAVELAAIHEAVPRAWDPKSAAQRSAAIRESTPVTARR